MSAALHHFAFAELTAFPILGFGGGPVLDRYVGRHRVRLTRAPHDADLLVLAGEIPPGWADALRSLFETFTLPRAAVWLPPRWPCPPPEGLPLTDGDPRQVLLDPSAPANRPLLDDKPRSPWRGQGDHGQGGEGMMGGKPYGRPMAMVGPDPDGLMLGAVSTSLGPFFPGMPSGLQLELTMQGDRISSLQTTRNWFPQRVADDARVAPELAPALQAARGKEVRIADLERARTRSHLVWAAAFLELCGLDALSRRFLDGLEMTRATELEALFAAAERTGLRRVCEGVGRLPFGVVYDHNLVGPLARASGRARDARARDSGYAALGFEAETRSDGDVWARWEVHRSECLQSAHLLEVVGQRRTRAAEAPRGTIRCEDGRMRSPSEVNLAALEHLLPGLVWSEAILVIASLDLDMAEAALR